MSQISIDDFVNRLPTIDPEDKESYQDGSKKVGLSFTDHLDNPHFNVFIVMGKGNIEGNDVVYYKKVDLRTDGKGKIIDFQDNCEEMVLPLQTKYIQGIYPLGNE